MATAHDFVVGGIYYNITDATNKTVAVTYKGSSYSAYFNEYTGDVVIPESVTYNGTTYSVTSIGEDAFFGCSALTSIEIPNSVTSIGEYAFRNCTSLTSIEIPNSVTSIVNYAFEYCTGLASVEIPSSVTSIGSYAFYYCTGLTSIVVDGNNTKYDSRENCNAIIETETNTLIIGFKNTVIPNSVTNIGERAFYDCTGLTSIEIPNSVTSIGAYAFRNCTGLTSIEIPNSVTSIGYSAFEYCTGLTSIEIPSSVTSIGYCAFRWCTGLTCVVIGNSVTSIGSSAFSGCSGLKTVINFSNLTFGKGTSNYGYVAYYADKVFNAPNGYIDGDFVWYENESGMSLAGYLGNATELTLPADYNGDNYTIGADAFKDNTTITSIVIPGSVTSIGSSAFSGCSGLKTVTNFSNLTFSKGSSNNGDVAYYADKVINAPNGYIDGDFVWYENEDGITLAGYLGNATELTLPTEYNGKSVTSIGSYAFSYCSGLTSVEIPKSVTSIGNSAFSGCTGLISVEFNAENCTSMGDYYYPVFNGCTALSTVTIGENVKTIPSSAFYGCSGLKTVVNLSNLTFSKGSSNYGYVAYYADKVINAPSGYIDGDFVWYENESGMSLAGYFGNATELTLPTEYNGKSVTSIGGSALYGCSGLTSVEIPNNVTSIGNSAFKGCNDLQTLYIGNSIESIGDEAFANCDRITDIKVALEKPVSGSKDIFADAVYDDAILYVPIGAKYRYEKREPWNLFFDIVEMDFTGIDNVKAENGTVKTVYDLQGRKVDNPINGVYIINGKKVLLK